MQLSCKQDLKANDIEFCDLWNRSGVCQEAWNGKGIIYEIPKEKWNEMDSGKELSHYLYFVSKETPGILLKWNRRLSTAEKEQYKKSCQAEYIWNNEYTGHMEGNDWGDNYLGYFQYLGSILEKEMKIRSIWEEKPNLKNFQNVPIEFTIHCLDQKFSLTGIISIAIKDSRQL